MLQENIDGSRDYNRLMDEAKHHYELADTGTEQHRPASAPTSTPRHNCIDRAAVRLNHLLGTNLELDAVC